MTFKDLVLLKKEGTTGSRRVLLALEEGRLAAARNKDEGSNFKTLQQQSK
jgi:hypothetical protein